MSSSTKRAASASAAAAKKSRKVCLNCREQPYSSAERLCDKCLRKLSRVECDCCRIDFHQLAVDAEAKLAPTCHECNKKVRQLGAPSACDYCGVRAAWSGGKCSRCLQFELEHGAPTECAECKLVCAFEKDAAQRAKVDGLVLCFLCTRKYKRRRHDEERKGSAATPAEWSAKCDALQRELAALKKAHAVELKKMAADTSALVTPLTATLEQARRDEHQKARELKDLDRQYGALASEAHTLEKRLRGLQNEHNDLTALCAQLTLELATLGDKVAPVKPEPVNKAVSSSNAFVRREESR